MPVLAALPLILIVVLAIAVLPSVAASGAAHHTVEVRLFPGEHRIEVLDVVEGLEPDGEVSFEVARPVEIRARVDGLEVEVAQEGKRRIITVPSSGDPISLEYTFALPSDVQSDGPFLNGAHGFVPGWTDWLPTFGSGESFTVTVQTPMPLKALATGSLVEETETDDFYRARFILPLGSEPPSLFAGRFVVGEREVDGVRLRTYLTEATARLSSLYLDRTAEYIRRFEALVGAHPYDSFSVIAAPLPVGLGFPGVTYVSERILPLPFMQTRSLAHEILHGWWGNAVRVAYDEGNWAEGLTTYMADYGILDDPAAEAAMRLAWLRDYAALPASEDAALTDFVARSHDASQIVGYNKAAFVFHMLRRRLGDDRFHAALKRFYESHRFERASWSDLQASFEEAAEDGLGWFFAQWLEHPGAPALTLEKATADERLVEMTLGQDEPPWRLAVPVRIETTAGDEEHVVALHGARTTASIPTDAPALAVAVDPEHHVFRRLAPGEAPAIVRDVTLDPKARAVLAVPDDSHDLALQLATKLLGKDPLISAPDVLGDHPVLVITLSADAWPALGAGGLDAPPAAVRGRGTARVWTTDRDGSPVLVVEADDRAALDALLRPLPHYRRDSWLVFEGGTAVDRGVWPAGDSPLRRKFAQR